MLSCVHPFPSSLQELRENCPQVGADVQRPCDKKTIPETTKRNRQNEEKNKNPVSQYLKCEPS